MGGFEKLGSKPGLDWRRGITKAKAIKRQGKREQGSWAGELQSKERGSRKK